MGLADPALTAAASTAHRATMRFLAATALARSRGAKPCVSRALLSQRGPFFGLPNPLPRVTEIRLSVWQPATNLRHVGRCHRW